MTTPRSRPFRSALAGLCALGAAFPAFAVEPAPTPAPPPTGEALIPAELAGFTPAIYVEDKTSASVENAAVEGRPFTKTLRLTVVKPSAQPWQLGTNAKTVGPVRKGDALWVSFQSRRLQTRQETGEAVAEVTFMQKDANGKETRPLERGFSCGPDWIETSIPFVATQDSEAGAATLSIRFGSAVQSLEVGGVTLLNCGPRADLASLPRTVTRYEGHAADAPWRAAAAARIEQLRKGDFPLRVVDAAGRPVADAAVAVRMRRHAFAWGAALDSRNLVDNQTPDGDRFRETVEKYFNKVVFENELKWNRWLQEKPADRARTLAALDWLDARKIPARGHVLLWPSWRQTPPFLRPLEHDPAALRAAIAGHITEMTALYGSRLAEWDVINETFVHHDLMDVLGRDAMADWFRQARAGAPKTTLFYNDYTMFHGASPNSPSQHFLGVIQFLREQGAPLGGIGEQGHFGGNPPGPAQIIAQLDRFGQFGLPIQISEFDIETPDEQLAADFTRDFTTAVFSHPAITGMVQWGFWEGAHWKPSAALWRKDWSLRPSGQAWVDLVSKTWWTNADGRTGADGTYRTRGFYGDYDVTVTRADGKTQTVPLKLAPGAAVQTVALP